MMEPETVLDMLTIFLCKGQLNIVEAPDLGRSNKQVRPTYGLTMTMHPAILANSLYIYQASGQIRVPSVQLARKGGGGKGGRGRNLGRKM